MKKILILVDSIKEKHQLLADAVSRHLPKKSFVMLATFSDVFIYLHNGEAQVKVQNKDMFDFQVVHFRRIGGQFMAMAYTLAAILKANNIRVINHAYKTSGISGDKFTSLTQLTLSGLPTVDSVFVCEESVTKYAHEIEHALSFPLVAKDRFAQRGRGVSLVKNKKELLGIFKKNKRQQFMFQKFIESKQEYRLLVLGNTVRIFEKKTPTNRSEFRANVALGATEEFLPLSELPKEMKAIAILAARALHLEIAGVDIMEDTSGKYWLLEVNRGPGLTYDEDISPELREMGKYLSEVN